MFSQRLSLLACAALVVGCSSSNPTTSTPATTATASPTPTPSASATSPSVSSSNQNLLNVAPYRGFNYNGTGPDGAVTATLYDEPVSGNSENLVVFQQAGTEATAFGGQESSAFPYPLASLAMPASFVQGAVTTIVPGVTETVTAIGMVPGSSACPTPVSPGVTIQYAAESYTGTISYVPNCGITNISGEGVNLTLVSIGSYPNEATQVRARADMASTTIHTGRGDMIVQFRQKPVASMPDIYDTEHYGQAMADLLGHGAGANGQSFSPDASLMKTTQGVGAIAFIERRLAEAKRDPSGVYALSNGTKLSSDAFSRYACAFGVSGEGTGRLEHARNIGLVWVSGASHACSNTQSYTAMRELASVAIDDLTK